MFPWRAKTNGSNVNRDGLGQGPWPPFSIGIHEILQGATHRQGTVYSLKCATRYMRDTLCQITREEWLSGKGMPSSGSKTAVISSEDFRLHFKSTLQHANWKSLLIVSIRFGRFIKAFCNVFESSNRREHFFSISHDYFVIVHESNFVQSRILIF